MSETVTAIPTFGFARGAIVRKTDGGPNMLVVRDLAETVCVVRCEGDEAGTLRLREEPKHDLVQVLNHDGRSQLAAETTSLRAQLDEARARVKTFEMAIAQLPEMPAIMDERAARRRAIEDAANVVARSVFPLPTDAEIARDGGGIAVMRAAAMARDAIEQQIRALLSESKS